MSRFYLLLFFCFLSVGVSGQELRDALLQVFRQVASAGQTFVGHQDDTMYGHSWYSEAPGRSDMREVCGQWPMVLSLDLCPLELENGYYLFGTTWDQHRQAILEHHRRGGIITLCWHMRNPVTGGTAWDLSEPRAVSLILRGGEARRRFLHFLDVAAEYILTLRDDEGQLIPVVFRPFHEAQGSWFWWGRDLCSSRQYRRLWRLTRQYLTDRGCSNLLYCFSLSGVTASESDYLERFPGREYVDVLGTELYRNNDIPGVEARRADFIRRAHQNLSVVEQIGQRWGMPVCVAEAGGVNNDDPRWWTLAVLPALQGHAVSYINFWANQPDSFSGGPWRSMSTYPGAVDADDLRQALSTGRLVMCP